MRGAFDELLDMLVPERPARVLDIGAGQGQMVDLLLDALPDARVWAIDSNARMIHSLYLRHRAEFENGRLDLCTMRLSRGRLPYANRLFDAVICKDIVDWVSAPSKLLGEACRTLRPGGLLIAAETDFGGISYSGVDGDLVRRMALAYAKERHRPQRFDFSAADRLPKLVEGAGFKVLGTRRFELQDHGYRHYSEGRTMTEAITFMLQGCPWHHDDLRKLTEHLRAREHDEQLHFEIATEIVAGRRQGSAPAAPL